MLYLEFVHHFFKHLLGFRAMGLLEVVHDAYLHDDGLQVPAHTWGQRCCLAFPFLVWRWPRHNQDGASNPPKHSSKPNAPRETPP